MYTQSMKRKWKRLSDKVVSLMSLLEIRPYGIFEILLMLVLLMIIQELFGHGNRFTGVEPHPFWIIVLVISGQYGVKEGVIASALCTLALYVGNFPEQDIGTDYYQFIAQVSQLPILWFSAAIVLGMVSQRRIRETQRLRGELAESIHREHTVAEAYEQLKEAKEIIEMRLVGQLRSSTLAYRALQSIGSLDPNEVLFNIDEVLKVVMKPKKMSVYGMGEQGLEVVSSLGWGIHEKYSLRIARETKLYQSLLSKKKTLCVVNKGDEEILAGEGVMATPLITPDTGQIFGVIKIEEMEFENITLSNIETFSLLSEWISLAYANAKKIQERLNSASH